MNKLVLIPLVGAVVVFSLITFSLPDTFESEAIITSQIVITLFRGKITLSPQIFPTDVALRKAIVDEVYEKNEVALGDVGRQDFQKQLSVSQRGKLLWVLRVETHDPALSAKIANDWAEAVLARINFINVVSEEEHLYLEKQLLWSFGQAERTRLSILDLSEPVDLALWDAKVGIAKDAYVGNLNNINILENLLSEIENFKIQYESTEITYSQLNVIDQVRWQGYMNIYQFLIQGGGLSDVESVVLGSDGKTISYNIKMLITELDRLGEELNSQTSGLEEEVERIEKEIINAEMITLGLTDRMRQMWIRYNDILEVSEVINFYIADNPPLFVAIQPAEPEPDPSGPNAILGAVIAVMLGIGGTMIFVAVKEWGEIFPATSN